MADKTIDTQLLTYFHALAKPQQLNVLNYLKSLLKKENVKKGEKTSVYDFLGVLSEEEAEHMKKEIEASCENIHEEDWR